MNATWFVGKKQVDAIDAETHFLENTRVFSPVYGHGVVRRHAESSTMYEVEFYGKATKTLTVVEISELLSRGARKNFKVTVTVNERRYTKVASAPGLHSMFRGLLLGAAHKSRDCRNRVCSYH